MFDPVQDERLEESENVLPTKIFIQENMYSFTTQVIENGIL